MIERRAAMTPEQRAVARGRRSERAAGAMSVEQAQFRRELRTYQQGLREKAAELRAAMQAGSITSEDMARQLQAYRAANRPANPAGATRPPGPR
jgi:hypothetical protein